IEPVAAQVRVRPHRGLDHEIPGRAAAGAGRALAGEADRRAGVGAGRDPHAHRALLGELERDLGAVDRLAQVHRDGRVQILTAARPAAPAAEQLAEIELDRPALEVGRALLLARALPPGVLARLVGIEPALERLVAELVVGGAPLVVREHLVGGRDPLEPLLRLLVARVDVGVVLARELAVRAPDRVRLRVLRDPEHLVERLRHGFDLTLPGVPRTRYAR